ncbi:unnamed protein product [Bursaphelenchus okinawaensis]|uniref:SSD domain-containing protein n=1 Tax=Bursaphelenchus okinawaensis TaxID=465554 RepID=A0A811K0N5_9BILA|nr:unnamed protein product [Bursaphelenchus okinawaensis]CAG9088322.1 unnamed protein product [Bursaphelenchus okinawaensis]
MLTLIEPPGKKRGHSRANNRSGQHLLNFGAPNDDDFEEEFETVHSEPFVANSWIEEKLVGGTSSADFSTKWKRDFSQRPTFCDADLSLQQILRGNAKGNVIALYARCLVQKLLFNLGEFAQSHSLLVILTVFSVFSICSIGLQYVRIETDIVKLWVSEGGRLNEELKFFERVQDRYANLSWTEYDEQHFVRESNDPLLKQIKEDEIKTSDYQVLIQTVDQPGQNLLTKNGLKTHVDLLNTIVNLQVTHLGVNWTLSDICFKPGALDINEDSVAYQMKPVLERLIPCIWITPIDCFFEGSQPIGPNPPIRMDDMFLAPLLKLAVPELQDETTWGNINPELVVRRLKDTFDLGTMANFFSRTGIGKGYLDRPCIDPLDQACPEKAPNFYKTCTPMKMLQLYLKDQNKTLEQELEPFKEATVSASDSSLGIGDIFGIFMAQPEKKKTENMTDAELCNENRAAFLKWIQADQSRAKRILGEQNLPKEPDYGQIMRKGCNGFARGVMNWPVDMILGKAEDDGNNFQAEALQSVILVASATEVYKRFSGKDKIDQLRYLNESSGLLRNATGEWSPLLAKDVVTAWQRAFTDTIYNHPLNFKVVNGSTDKVEHRVVHPLAATSISDMLAEFCDFNYGVIVIGYVLMLLYALYSQIRRESCCLLAAESAVGLAFAGVLTVTFASVAGLGLVTWFGVEFNAATTQIVPFLTLGIGVDNMFMLLHNYHRVFADVKKNELGLLLKETGMSILMTSSNNILSFLTGTILPIPALRSFCTQSSVLLFFNLIAILTVYPAIIAIDIRRRKSGRRDVCCCLQSSNSAEQDMYDDPPYGYDLTGGVPTVLTTKSHYHGLISVGKGDDEEAEEIQPWSLRAFLRNYYVPFLSNNCVKFGIIVLCASLFVAGVAGINRSTMGLELGDVLPENTAPAAFLKARDSYFSFYPMNVIIRGENVDFAEKQTQIEQLRNEIAKSQYVVKLENGEPSERYWLGMFRQWLRGLQQKLDEAREQGILKDFDKNNATKSPELKIAYSLACSYGKHYDCSRVDRIRLIDDSDTINTEGFYNYLYGWHEYEQMFYTVSQASFYPPLRKLKQGPNNNRYRYFVPPAPKPVYSQIPFYLNGLKDTTTIVNMIKEIRAISDNYTHSGLPNHPSGIAFTFWEQYLDLNYNLVKAITIISIAVFIVVSILLFNPWAAFCIVIILFLMTVELAGFLGFYNIKLNPVSAVSLITAVGIGVEFTAHVVFAFLTSLGTRNERMASAIDQVFVPVIHGALSTLLGILMLGFSEFEFVVKYFFLVMNALIILGLINGLMLLPVLLSIIGPACELTPRDFSNRLPVPPPLERRGNQSSNRHGILRVTS